MTQTSPPARPIALEVAPDGVYGTFHDTAAETPGPAVLICPPWGWDEITSYRARREWARRLAAEGHPTLRIDLPGAGDSAGGPTDPDRVDAWCSAIRASAAWLAARPGVTRVAAIGLGLGGLLAETAIAAGAPIADLVLWASPETGRSFLREQRAFASLQTARLDPTGALGSLGGAEGLEVGGFLLAAETIEDLGKLDAAALLTRRPPERVLLLDRDGMGDTRRLATRLRELEIEVAEAIGAGWADMVFHPEQYSEPEPIFARVSAWLAAGTALSSDAGESAVPVPREVPSLEVAEGGARVRETPIRIPQPLGELSGIVTEPVDRPLRPVIAVFLNAGAVRRVGPNRLWVEAARRWAARGVPSVRMDLAGLGDADGDPRQYADVGKFYTPEFGASVAAIVDDVVARGLGPDCVLIGLCAGGYWAFHTAADDPRVVAALILNPRAMIWDDGLLTRREARKGGQILEPGVWKRLARGEIGWSRVAAVSGAVAATAIRSLQRVPARVAERLGPPAPASGDPVERRLDTLRDRGTRVVLAFSGEEPVYDELATDGVIGHLDRWPNVELVTLPGADHTIRPLPAQEAALRLLDRELDRLLARESAPEPAPEPAGV